jgi:hypothetical protein
MGAAAMPHKEGATYAVPIATGSLATTVLTIAGNLAIVLF